MPVSAVAPAILISEMEFEKKETSTGSAADPAAARARSGREGATVEKIYPAVSAPAFAMLRSRDLPAEGDAPRSALAAQASVPAGDNDQTLRAMHDEMERARTRLALPGVDKPFYIEYRLLDVDVRSVTASFGSFSADRPRAAAS